MSWGSVSPAYPLPHKCLLPIFSALAAPCPLHWQFMTQNYVTKCWCCCCCCQILYKICAYKWIPRMGARAGGVATKLHKICVKLYDNDLGAWPGRRKWSSWWRAGRRKLHVRENGVQILHTANSSTPTHTHSYERHTPAILIFFVCSSRSWVLCWCFVLLVVVVVIMINRRHLTQRTRIYNAPHTRTHPHTLVHTRSYAAHCIFG